MCVSAVCFFPLPLNQNLWTRSFSNLLFYHSYREPKILDSGGESHWPPFSEEKNNFVTITSKPRSNVNFRFCQMALWSGIISRLQSATCEALWGITKFSEDALAVVDQALQKGEKSSAVVSTVLNKTLQFENGQVGNGALLNIFGNKTLLPQTDSKVGNAAIINKVNTSFFPFPNVPRSPIG